MNQTKFESNTEIVEHVNSAGGRTKKIIVLETCENCHVEFFATIQDANARKLKGTTVLCPVCRADDLKRIKREYEQQKKRWRNQK